MFDIEVARFLQGRRGLEMRSPEFGEAFEAYIHHEIKTYCDYKGGVICVTGGQPQALRLILSSTEKQRLR